MVNVLVIGDPRADGHVELIVRELRSRGARVVALNPSDLPSASETLTLGRGRPLEGWVESADGERLGLAEIDAVAYWTMWADVAVPGMDDEPRMLSEDEWVAWITNLAFLTPQARWVNPLVPRLLGVPRLEQLRLAQGLGLTIPETLVTNSPEEARRFVARHPGGVANKRLTNLMRPLRGYSTTYQLLTSRIDLEALDAADPASIRLAPTVFQEYVPKDVELRANVLGGQVLSAEILSQQDPQTTVDWRDYPIVQGPEGLDLDTSRWRARPTRLAPDLERTLVELVRRMGLVYSAVDLIRRPDGVVVFLEANYGGAFGWLEDMTGLPILARYVDLLLGVPAEGTLERGAGAAPAVR
jgi:hypothetical protein